MNNTIAFYILCRAWEHLLNGPDYSRGDSDALTVISDAKRALIFDYACEDDHIDVILACKGWKDKLMHAEETAVVA